MNAPLPPNHAPNKRNTRPKAHFSPARIFRLAILILGFALIVFLLFTNSSLLMG
ncbi:hypothetical protein NGM44_09660 [Moraxella sp. FZFQ2102]|uniref:hypothetical protein n=1 Tax=Moraxella sp. FZFQ2102 TaxID=2953752 RepID=UPI00209C51B0|nr:hypothetical protein [Moraxella sp. FZFQ2102]USZ14612.1 hypothetical protein NGM44_09660 [Moraxella sp. FZFQ2102]